MNGRCESARHEDLGGVVERRRFVPSPPCLQPGDSAPADANPLSTLGEEEQRRLLPLIGSAIDAVHRYRVAHGSLSHDRLFAVNGSVLIEGVGAVWNGQSEGLSPRERDLEWFRRECERFLGPPLQPAVGRTCRGMIAAWREPPPAPKVVSRNGRPAPTKVVLRRPRERIGMPWRWIGVVCVIAGVVGGVAAWQLTPLPSYALRTARLAFRKLPESVRNGLDPNGRFDPVGHRLQLQASTDRWERLELNLLMQRQPALVEVLTEEGEDYTELFRKFLKANDPSFFAWVSFQYLRPGPWAVKSLPRLKQLLDEQTTPNAARRLLLICFLRAAEINELSQILSILDAGGSPDVVAEACAALARIGRPVPIAKLIESSAEAPQSTTNTYLGAALYYYPPDDGQKFLAAYSVSRRWATLADAWQEVLDVVERAPPSPMRARAASVFERVLRESLPGTLGSVGASADADLLMTLHCLWRLQTVSPEELLHRLSEPTEQGKRIRSRLSAMLVGDAKNPPDKLPLPADWDVPDEWFAAVLTDEVRYPEFFVQDALFQSRANLSRIPQQSRLLALANLRPEEARKSMAKHLSEKLKTNHDDWRTSKPHLISTVCALLAASRTPTADAVLAEHFAPGPFAREAASWDGLLVGACFDPARHRALLQKAATHPLPSVWLRARQWLALADGDPAAFRNPSRVRPEWPEPLAELVSQLEMTSTEADAFVALSRQRLGHLAELALGLSASPGATAVLHARMDHNESPMSTYRLIANQPGPYDRKRFEEFLRPEPPYQLYDTSVMIGHVLKNDDSSLDAVRAIAVGPRAGKSSPPLLHRATAVYAFGALRAGRAEPQDVAEILSVIDRDASLLVRQAAAAAALHCVRSVDKQLLLDFAVKRPSLPPSIADVLRLANKL